MEPFLIAVWAFINLKLSFGLPDNFALPLWAWAIALGFVDLICGKIMKSFK